MLAWISANLGTIVVCAVLLLIIGWIIVSMIRRRKKGKTSCGCSCGSCPMHDACHPKK
jgi:hypothetical protein